MAAKTIRWKIDGKLYSGYLQHPRINLKITKNESNAKESIQHHL